MKKVLTAVISDECPLTPKCKRIFELKAVGKTEKEIAEIIHRGQCTINTQVGQILTKMDCKNISQAVAKAYADGWLRFKYVDTKY